MTSDTHKTNPGPEAQPTPKPGSDERLDRAHASIQRNVYWAMGAGVLPLPVVDIVAITGVQLKMLRELSQLYDVPFREGVAKKAVTSLLVGVGGVGIGGLIGASLFKSIPLIGQSLGSVSVSVISGMLTHAVGRTFARHFEAGGTLLDLDTKKMRKHFKEEYGSAREVVENMKRNQDQAEPAQAPRN